MALTGTDRGVGSHNTSATSFTLSPASNFTAGALAVLCIAVDNSDTDGNYHGDSGPYYVTDSLGNSWDRRLACIQDPGAADEGVEGAIFTSPQDGGTIQTGTVITVTFGIATTAKAWTIMEVTSSSGTPNFVTYEAGTGSSTATPTLTSAGSLPDTQMIIAAVFCERGSGMTITQDGDSTNGTWSTQQTTGVGTGTAGISIASQRKVMTALATQTYNPTLSIICDNVIGYITVGESLNITADVGALTLAGLAPTVVALQNKYVTTDVGALALSGLAPTVVATNTLVGTDRGTGNDNTSATSFTLSPASNFATGLAVLVIAADNAEVDGVAHTQFYVTDSLGNTWERGLTALYDPGAASDGTEGGIFYTSQDGGLLTTGTTITVTFAVATTAKAWTLMEITSSISQPYFDTYEAGTGSSTDTPTLTTIATIPTGIMIIAALFNERGSGQVITGDSDTTYGSWSTVQTNGAGAGVLGQTVASQRKIVTTSSYQTFNPTMGTMSDVILGYITVGERAEVYPGLGALTLTGHAPTLSLPKNVNPSVGSLAFTGYAPVVVGAGVSAGEIRWAGNITSRHRLTPKVKKRI